MNTERKNQLKEAVRKWWLKNLISLILLGAVLFISSGEGTWMMMWIYLSSLFIIVVANAVAMDLQLMVERSQLQEGTKKWDVPLVSFVAIWGPLLTLVIAGLDRRYGWSSGLLSELQIAALILVILGGLLGTWSMASNKFFSATIRIQSDRNHQVITRGPYRLIRHPGYAGGIISILMTPIALGSWFALIPGVLVSCGYAVRTLLEDKVLQEELDGYREYTRKVRYRLVPWIW